LNLSIITPLFDFFLPRFCFVCNRKLEPDTVVICPDCLSKIQLADRERLEEEYKRKFYGNGIIIDFKSVFVFEKDKELQHVIHALKYEKRFSIGLFLGKVLGKTLREIIPSWEINLIIPVPLHHLKKAERGYNQSAYIAKGLSKELKLPYNERAIKRTRFTESQTTMTLQERQANIEGVFAVRNKNKVKAKNILLVDDVITTGSTISECGKVLLEAGTNKIYAASVAIAD
jgi:ComF family protein